MYQYFDGKSSRRPRYDNEHPSYETNLELWDKCRTCFRGEEAVKDGNHLYLPFLSNQESPEYFRYKNRAIFLNVLRRTIQGLVGAAVRKTPIIEVPAGLESHIEDCDMMGTSIQELIGDLLTDMLITGRVCLVVDRMENSRAYLTPYNAESFINWRMYMNIQNMAVFAEDIGDDV